jgi:hypothetical protein
VRPFLDDGRSPRGRREPRRPRRRGFSSCIGRAARWTSVVSSISVALSLSFATPAIAQYPRDRAANRQITEIISELYAQKRFAEAEEALLGMIRACGAECSPAMLARGWMYAGIAEGTGMGDQRAARESFDNALGLDPKVSLDLALADAQTVATFETARHETARRGGTAPMIGLPSGDATPSSTPAPTPVKARAGLVCTPTEREIQTRRPIPFECRTDDEVVRVSLRYREHTAAPWQTLELERDGTTFRATLPCEVTMNSGRLELFIVATDDAGDPLDTLGSKSEPVVLVLNPTSSVTPAYPGEDPPERCAERVLCPPDFPGCADGDEPVQGSVEWYRPRHWVSMHFAADAGFQGGSNVCTSNNSDYDCFTSGTDTPFPGVLPEGVAARPGELGDGYPGTDIATSPSVGTLRLLFGYDHAVSDRVSVAARLGYAFRGGPTTLDGEGFLPVHIEGRIAYWPRGLWGAGLLPYVHLGAGLAQVDLKKADVVVRDCTEEPGRQAFLDCIAATDDYAPSDDLELPTRRLDAYRKLGDAFVTVGGGISVPLGGRAALQLNVNALLMLPSVGVVVQPSIGVAYGL